MLRSLQIVLVSYAVFSYLIFGLAFVAYVNERSVLAGIMLTLGFACIAWRKTLPQPLQLSRRETFLLTGCLGLIVLLLSHTLLIPPFTVDDLSYHLYVPQQISLTGQLYFSPYNINSNMPMLFEFPMVVSFLYGVPPFLFNLTCLLGLLLTVYAIGRNHFKIHPTRLLVCLVLLASTPVVYELLFSAYVELFLTLILTFAFYQYLQFTDDRKHRTSWFLVSLFLGIACAVKYSAAFFVLIVFITEFFKNTSKKNYYAGAFITIAIFCPWYLKNWILLGNPTFPLMHSIFESPYLSTIRALNYSSILSAYSYGREPLDYLLLPLRILVGWQAPLIPGQLGFGGQLSLFTGICVFGLGFKSEKQRFLSIVGLGFFAVWVFYSQQVRFLLPVIPITLLAGVAAIGSWKYGRPVFLGLALIAVGQNAVNLKNLLQKEKIAPLISGAISQPEFLKMHLNKSYDFASTVNSHLDASRHKVFVIGNFGRNFYYKIPMVANTFYDSEFLDAAFATEKPDPEIWTGFLEREQITHILLDWDFYLSFNGNSDQIELTAVRDFFTQQTIEVAGRGNFRLYQLR